MSEVEIAPEDADLIVRAVLEPRPSEHPEVWAAVDSLVDRAASLDDLREHRLHLFADRRWPQTGRPVPSSVAAEKALAAALCLPIPGLLSRISAVWDGPMVVLKGPELARRYPDALLRPAGDIDLLVDDARRAHGALRAAGFRVTGDPRRYVDIHHLQPLVWQNLPVRIELHHVPKWLDGLEPPATAELLSLAVPAHGDAEGFLTLAPEAHAVLLAVHAWAHEPLHNLRDLLDIAILTAESDVREIERLARRWGVLRVWKTTHRVVEALFAGGRRPVALRLWARHLEAARGRTVAESHLQGWLSPYWVLPAQTAFQHTLRRVGALVRPVPGELWRTKLARTRLAARNARLGRSAHQRLLEETRLATPPALLLDQLERRRERQAGGRDQAGDGSAKDGRR